MNRGGGWRGRGGRPPRGNPRGRGFHGGDGSPRGGGPGVSGFPRGRGGYGDHTHRGPDLHGDGCQDFPPHHQYDQRPPHGGAMSSMDIMDTTGFQGAPPNVPVLPQEPMDVPDYEWPPPDYQWPPPEESDEGQKQEEHVHPAQSHQGYPHDQGATREEAPSKHFDMFQEGPPEQFSTGPDLKDRSHGSRRSLSPKRDIGNQPPPEKENCLRQEFPLEESPKMTGTPMVDESLRITVGNEHYRSKWRPIDQNAPTLSPLDRLDPRPDVPPASMANYGQPQMQPSLGREEPYGGRPPGPDAERGHGSHGSSVERYDVRRDDKDKEVDYERRGSRYERPDEGPDRKRGHYGMHQEDQRKEKERGREPAREDRDYRDEKPKEGRPRDPRRDKDFLAERSKKPASSLSPSDIPPLYHFLGKSEPKKLGSEADEAKKRTSSQRPGIPLPTKSRHASSTAPSSSIQSKPIECAPDVAEPPKALKSILKKRKPHVESKKSKEAPDEPPPSTHSQSPSTVPRQSPVTVPNQTPPIHQQERLDMIGHRQELHNSPQLSRPLEPPPPEVVVSSFISEQIMNSSQPDVSPMHALLHPEVQVAPPEVQVAPQSEQPALSVSDELSAELPGVNLNTLLSSLSKLVQGATSTPQTVSQIHEYQQGIPEQIQQQVQQPLQQLIQQPVQVQTLFEHLPQAQVPQQMYPTGSQQIHSGFFQPTNPVSAQQPFPLVSPPAQPVGFPLSGVGVSHQAFSSAAQQLVPSIHQQAPLMAPQPSLPVSVNSQQTYQAVQQQTSTPALALDEVTASKIRELAQSLGQNILTSSQSSAPRLFPSADPDAGTNYLSQARQSQDIQVTTVAASPQIQSQMQDVPFSSAEDTNVFRNLVTSQPKTFTTQLEPKPVKQSQSAFVSLDDEDLFLYGDAYTDEKYREAEKKAKQVPSPKSEETKPETHVEPPSEDQIKNILSAIGFDFGLAQKIKEQKEQKEREKASKQSTSKQPKAASKSDETIKRQRPSAEVSPDANIIDPPQIASATVTEESLKGFNKTASFLDTGLKTEANEELNQFIREAKKNVSKHKRQSSEKKSKTTEVSRSHSRDKSEKKRDKSEEKVKREMPDTTPNSQSLAIEDKYTMNQMSIPTQISGHPNTLPENTTQQSQEVIYQHIYQNEPFQNTAQELYYGKTTGGETQQGQTYPPIEQTVQFVGSLESHPVPREPQSFQPENIFISVNTAADSSGSNRVVLLPKPNPVAPVIDERQRRILEIERRYQQSREPAEVKQLLESEREKERRLRLEAEELIEKEKQRLREERKRKEEEERKQKEEERLRKKEEERKEKEKERRKKEEERKRKEEEERRKKEAEKEKEKEFDRFLQMDVEPNVYQERVNELESELEKLHKKNLDLKRQTFLTTSHKESLLAENNALQDKICDKLRALRRRMNQQREEAQTKRETHSKERSPSPFKERRPSKDSSKPSKSERFSKDSVERTMQKESSKATSKDKKEKKRGIVLEFMPKEEKTNTSFEKSDKALRFEFNYYDPGSHWCKLCNMQSTTLNELFVHLHSKGHSKNCDPYDRPWMQDVLPKSKKKAANTIDAPIRGTEFVMPVNGFFCRLCKEFFGDGLCASEHLKTSKHNRAYEKLIEEDSYYEKRLSIEKAAGRAQKLKMAVHEERDQKRKQEGDEEMQSEDDTPSKKAKTEQDTKTPPVTGQKGFGVFKKTGTENLNAKAKEESPAVSQAESKPEKIPPVSKPPQGVPPPSQPLKSPTAPTQAQKKAALAAKLAPMVGKMRGPSNKFLLRKTAAPKFPQPSKLVTQSPFTDSSQKTLTFDTLPIVKDKPVDVKKELQAVNLTQTDIADAFKGKHIEEKQRPKVAPTARPQAPPSQPAAKAPAWPQVQPKQKQGMFGPALPPPGSQPKLVSLEDMDEEDVCVPGMDDDIQTLPDFLPKPKPPPPVTASSPSAPSSGASALASSTATNLYNIFYKPID